ncbi:hypothetical protein [Mycobacterium kiyosense]
MVCTAAPGVVVMTSLMLSVVISETRRPVVTAVSSSAWSRPAVPGGSVSAAREASVSVLVRYDTVAWLWRRCGIAKI